MRHGLTYAMMVVVLALASCASTSMDNSTAMAPSPAVEAPTNEMNCRLAVAKMANRPVDDTSVLASDASSAGAGIKVALKGADRPWSCIVDANGAVTNVMYMGEG